MPLCNIIHYPPVRPVMITTKSPCRLGLVIVVLVCNGIRTVPDFRKPSTAGNIGSYIHRHDDHHHAPGVSPLQRNPTTRTSTTTIILLPPPPPPPPLFRLINIIKIRVVGIGWNMSIPFFPMIFGNRIITNVHWTRGMSFTFPIIGGTPQSI